MVKTLKNCFLLKNAYEVNSILYSLKQIPFIKKLLPNSLYGAKGLKLFANVLSVAWELLSSFLGKLLYFLLMIYLMLEIYNGMDKGDLFLHILFFLSIIGAFMNTYLFNPSKGKYYGIILLRMNAKEVTLINYFYSIVKLIIGFLCFGLIFGRAAEVPVWVCLIIPFFVAGLKITVGAYGLCRYEKSGEVTNENTLGKFGWIVTVVLLATAYGLPLLKIVLPQWILVLLMFIPILTGLFFVRKIYNFQFYPEYCKQLLRAPGLQKDTVAKVMRDQSNKLISVDTAITSERKGVEYLNEIFIKRHRKLLWKASQKVTYVSLGVIMAVLFALYWIPELREVINSLIMTDLPWFVFIMYMINRGTGFTQALFMNCDHSLLTYSFYKQPKFMLHLFRIRLWEIIKINLLPAVVIGCGLALLLCVSGGTDNVVNYVVLVVSIPAVSIFFSVHYLTIYYLLQPYNAATEMKSATYQIALTVTYLFCFFIIKLKISSLLFGMMAILFCLIYCVVACIIVYKIAPKTFKLRK